MIFITLGSQKFQFNRLLKKVDELIEKGFITEEVFAQTGASDYRPRNYRYKDFLGRDEFKKIIEGCDMVITHGGTGAIITAVKLEKKVVAVPRLAKYNEHVDDHQTQLISQFDELNLICPCSDIDCLAQKINEARNKSFSKYKSNTEKYISSLREFIDKQ